MSIATSHWKWFAFMWAWPFLFLAMIFLPGFASHSLIVFFAIDFPAMVVCFYLASKPYRDKKITLGQSVWWACIVPFLIWAALIFGIFGLTWVHESA